MLEQLELAQQRWGGQLPVIDNWLNERRELLVSYCQLSGSIPGNTDQRQLPTPEEVERFCQLLVDYVSSGHFEVYNKLLNLCEKSEARLAENAHQVVPGLNAGTDTALRFNDRYGELSNENQLLDLDADLSHLGEWLEQHLRLEDRLLQTTLQAHHASQGHTAQAGNS